MVNIDYKKIKDLLVCPNCASNLALLDIEIQCRGCGKKYSMKSGILSFLPEEETHYWQKYHSESLKNTTNETQQVNYFSDKNFWMANRVIKQKIGDRKGCNILDVGCGHGLMSQWLVAENNVMGVDFSLEMLKAAKERGLFPLHADAMQLPVRTSSFDVVMSIEVVQCMDNAKQYIVYLSKFVKPGGIMLISGLNLYSIQRKLFWKIYSFIKPDHILPKLIDPIILADNLSKSGFEVEISYTCYPFNKTVSGKVGDFRRCRLGTTFFIRAQHTV